MTAVDQALGVLPAVVAGAGPDAGGAAPAASNGNTSGNRDVDAHAPSAAAVAATPTTSAASDASAAAKGELLSAVFDVLDRDGLAYCVLHGYEQYPHRVTSDVDILVPREMLPRRLGELLRANEGKLGARVVQWFNDRAHFIVLARTGADKSVPPVLLQLHVSTDYDVHNRLVYSGNEILTTRRPGPGGRTGRRR